MKYFLLTASKIFKYLLQKLLDYFENTHLDIYAQMNHVREYVTTRNQELPTFVLCLSRLPSLPHSYIFFAPKNYAVMTLTSAQRALNSSLTTSLNDVASFWKKKTKKIEIKITVIFKNTVKIKIGVQHSFILANLKVGLGALLELSIICHYCWRTNFQKPIMKFPSLTLIVDCCLATHVKKSILGCLEEAYCT